MKHLIRSEESKNRLVLLCFLAVSLPMVFITYKVNTHEIPKGMDTQTTKSTEETMVNVAIDNVETPSVVEVASSSGSVSSGILGVSDSCDSNPVPKEFDIAKGVYGNCGQGNISESATVDFLPAGCTAGDSVAVSTNMIIKANTVCAPDPAFAGHRGNINDNALWKCPDDGSPCYIKMPPASKMYSTGYLINSTPNTLENTEPELNLLSTEKYTADLKTSSVGESTRNEPIYFDYWFAKDIYKDDGVAPNSASIMASVAYYAQNIPGVEVQNREYTLPVCAQNDVQNNTYIDLTKDGGCFPMHVEDSGQLRPITLGCNCNQKATDVNGNPITEWRCSFSADFSLYVTSPFGANSSSSQANQGKQASDSAVVAMSTPEELPDMIDSTVYDQAVAVGDAPIKSTSFLTLCVGTVSIGGLQNFPFITKCDYVYPIYNEYLAKQYTSAPGDPEIPTWEKTVDVLTNLYNAGGVYEAYNPPCKIDTSIL